MEIVNFENEMSNIKKKKIKEAIKELENCTNFILITSPDNCDSCEYCRFYVSNIEAIGLLETTKHHLLHNVMVDDDDDPEEKNPEIFAENGK